MIRIDADEGKIAFSGASDRLISEMGGVMVSVYEEICRREGERFALASMVSTVKEAIRVEKIPTRLILDAIRDVEEASHVAD